MALIWHSCFSQHAKATELIKSFLTFIQLTDLKLIILKKIILLCAILIFTLNSYSQQLQFKRIETLTTSDLENISINVPADEIYVLKSVSITNSSLNQCNISITDTDGFSNCYPLYNIQIQRVFNGNTGSYVNTTINPNLYIVPGCVITACEAGSGDDIYTFFVYDLPTNGIEIFTLSDYGLDFIVPDGKICQLLNVTQRLNVSNQSQYRQISLFKPPITETIVEWGSGYYNEQPYKLNQFYNSGWNIYSINPVGNLYNLILYDEDIFGETLSHDIIGYQPSIMAFPNPTNSELALDSDKQYEIKVFDLNGRKVMETTGNSLDMSILTNATYIVKAFDKESKETNTYKVVKN